MSIDFHFSGCSVTNNSNFSTVISFPDPLVSSLDLFSTLMPLANKRPCGDKVTGSNKKVKAAGVEGRKRLVDINFSSKCQDGGNSFRMIVVERQRL